MLLLRRQIAQQADRRRLGTLPPHPRHDEGAALLPQAAKYLKGRLIELAGPDQTIARLKPGQGLGEGRRRRIAGRADLALDQRRIGLPTPFGRAEGRPFQGIERNPVGLGRAVPCVGRPVADLGLLSLSRSGAAEDRKEGGGKDRKSH
ncbi:hypothetical protein D3C85_1092810 [compost metagenome]